jgi:hypothetical protein
MYCQRLEDDMAIIEGALSRPGDSIPREDFDTFFRPFLIRKTLARVRESLAR